ncbi:GNAT family N-acetyltransferase [Arthrobacter sp. B0490]|uniref:GNAT family N-acetyltransferase n=1 Tax=Arthrobacter sp. B0490 TaxID=2058891 RepID=UPI0015E2EDE7|nr:GNAT family N-acetyltransferase [Arthrobacter sp. B0490]
MDPPDVEHAMDTFPQTLDDPLRRQETSLSRAAKRARLAPVLFGAEPEIPADLGPVSSRRLRHLCDRTYQLLDQAQPFPEARERYDALVEELERREREAALQAGGQDTREKFRDNALFSRFELYHDGILAGYVQYEMRGGQLLLLHAVVDPGFRGTGLEPALMRAVFLDAHRRRLAVTPCCPEAQDFLADHPQFLSLIPARQRRRFRLLRASRTAAVEQDLR